MLTTEIGNLPHAKSASYDTHQAPDNEEPQGCMAGTHERILDVLEEWATSDTPSKVFWLNGMAGTGKTSIAHTLCERLDEKQMLGASFFCSRSTSEEVKEASLIIPTIAAKLSQASPPLRSEMVQSIEKEPDVGSMRILSRQFRLLLVGPIQRALDPSVKTYKAVVIDGLDECTDLRMVEKLIQAIVVFTLDMPLKFFLSSRDTTQIQSAIHHNPNYTPKIVPLDTIERTQQDIELYLHTSLSAIVTKHQLSIPWPPPNEFKILLEQSDKLFIYAATALRYIGAPDVDFRKRLTGITCLTPARMETGILDSLYNEIMRQAFCSQLKPEEVPWRRKVLSTVVFLVVPLSVEAIGSLFSMDSLQAWFALAPFRSVIHVPPVANISPVTIFHASFPDFIVDPSRCEETFRLDQSEGHQMLTVQCLRWLNQTLKRNICNPVSSSHELNTIPEALRCSCLHWASHLAHALASTLAQTSVTELRDLVSEFVDKHLLHWFECLSVLEELVSGINLLDTANEAISVSVKVASEILINSIHRHAQESTLNSWV